MKIPGLLSLIVIGFLLAAGCTTSMNSPAPADDFSTWTMTLVGDTTEIITLDDLSTLPVTSGHGYAVSTVGIRYGPYTCRGVLVTDLISRVATLEPGDRVWVSAPDGYLWVFDYDQLQGEGFVTFNENLQEIESPPLRILLMYEQNGTALSYDDGGPARIAIISDQPGVITEGSSWVKWVDRIEVKKGTA